MIKMLDVVGGTAGAGGVLGLESLFRPLVLVLAMGIALFVLVLGLADQRFLMGAGLLLYAAQMFNGAVVPVSANGYAALALVCVLLAGILRKRLPRFGVLVTGVFPAIYVYLALALLLLPRSVDMGESLKSIFLLVYLIVFCWCLLSAADGEDVRVVLRWTSGLVVAISMVLVIVMPSAAIGGYELDIVANRWRGLTQNPNALSTYAALFFLTAGTMTAAMVSLAPALVVMFGTASRAAALALGIVAGPQLLRGWGGTIKRLSVAVALVVAIPLLWTVLFSESTQPVDITNQNLVRTTNTRQKSWSGAVDAIQANPIGGLGPGNDFKSSEEGIPVSSSVLRPLVELGWPGLLPLGVVAFVGIRAARGRSSVFRTVFAFMIVHGIFEGWIFAGGSVFFAIFVLAASLMQRRSPFDGPWDRGSSGLARSEEVDDDDVGHLPVASLA
ncbi:MAG: O-antigen ligase family protein [Microthrixaceae bacterium]|jgi:O-antigen ligase|nr:O-antigen ligase family protein [Microthrixaceae bacterium]